MVQLYEKIRVTAGGFHSWWKSDAGIIRKPNSSIKKIEPKVAKVKIKKEEKHKVMYKVLRSIWKAIKYGLLVALGWTISGFISEEPGIAGKIVYGGWTLGGLLILGYDFLKHKVWPKLP